MPKVRIYVETDTGETEHLTLAEHATTLAALEQVEALFTLLANPWWGNPDLETVRAGVRALRDRQQRRQMVVAGASPAGASDAAFWQGVLGEEF